MRMASSTSNPEELRQNARSWTLEGDGKLLEFMESISAKLENRATATSRNINQLCLDVDRTNVALGNITNQLSALQNSQFVENRVYEDDETIANVTDVPAEDSNGNTSYDPLETLKTGLRNSITMMEQCYEKVTIDIEDSDEEEESSKNVIYRPKNPYEDRPIPYIIGSKEWIEKWHVGLCDSDEEFSGEENDEEFSESSENASISASLPSNAPTISESEFSVWGLHGNPEAAGKRAPGGFPSSDEDVSSNTRQSSDENKQSRMGVNVLFPQNHILSPDDPALDRYYVHQPKQKDRGLFDESTDESSDNDIYNLKPDRKMSIPEAAMAGPKMSNIFSDEPPDLDVVDKEERRPSVDLFYESDGEAVVVAPKKDESVGSNIRKKTVNLFDDEDFDSFMKELNNKTNQTLKKSDAGQKKARNLFDESSEEEESSSVAQTKKQVGNILEKSIETPIISVNTVAPIVPNESKTIPKANVEQKSPTAFATKAKPKEAVLECPHDLLPTKVMEKKKEVVNTPKARISLFDDEPPDDDFDDFLPTPTATKKLQYTNLFDDDPLEDDFDSFFKTKKDSSIEESVTIKSVEDPVPESKPKMFDDIETAPKPTNRSKMRSTDDVLQGPSNETPKLTSGSIFDDTTELPQPLPRARTILAKIDSSKLFSDISDDSALFGSEEHDIGKGEADPPLSEGYPDVVKADENTSQKLSNVNQIAENQSDLFDKVIPKTSTIPTNIENDFLDEVKADDLFGSESLKVVGEEHKENITNIHDSEDQSAEMSLGIKDSTVVEENRVQQQISTIEDEPNENSILTKTDLSSILNESSGQHTFETSSSKQLPKRDIFASTLFSDIPPDDDNIFDNPSSNLPVMDDNALFDGTSSATAAASSALNYNSVSLFHDIPPDDDFIKPTKDTKKLHNIFYDDFSETIVPAQPPQPKSISSYIYDEPPPDSFETTPESASNENKSDTTALRTGTQSKITALIDKVQKDIAGSSDGSFAISKPQPKKLNSNLNINVSALMPGAKRPSMKTIAVEKNTSTIYSDQYGGSGDSSNKTAKTVQIESDPSKLLSLNKTRPKIQVKRRPSTRKGRQENYRRSMVLEDEDKPQTTAELATDSKNTSGNLIDSISKTLFNDDLDNDSNDDWLASAVQNESCPPINSDESNVSDKSKLQKTIVREERPSVKESGKTLGLFPADVDFAKSNEQPKSKIGIYKATEKVPEVNTNITSNRNANSNAMQKSKKAKESQKIIKEVIFSRENNRPNNAPYKSFLDKESDDEDGAEPFEQNRSEPVNAVLPATTKSSKQSNLFFEGDDDDDDDDLFASAMATTVEVAKPLASNAHIRKISATEIQKNEPPEPLKPITIKSEKISIFDDQSDDEEDLFAKKLKTDRKIAQIQSKPKPIFGSDEDDGDDIFGSAASKLIVKSASNPVMTAKVNSSSSRTNIFDDVDDDEDLFVAVSSKSKNATKSMPKKIETKKSATAASTENDFNDPLADLLKKD